MSLDMDLNMLGAETMASVHDVAAYILSKCGRLTTMKLEKLVYYCQAWSLVWDERPVFHEEIQAWANGPVVPELYNHHRGQFEVSQWLKGKVDNLSDSDKETVDVVLSYYGEKSSQWLSDQTHKEKPWRLARRGLSDNERGNHVISHSSMAEYYSAVLARSRTQRIDE